ncbi:imidazole glycerol phosphate synthase subunit HisH [Desulfobacterota bacterium M19]
MTKVAIVNYGMGNLRSVANACHTLSADPTVIDDPKKLRNFGKIIVPGVGAFGEAIGHLRDSGMADALQEVFQTDRHLLGICLGMQLFCKDSKEYGNYQGLGWIDAEVRKFPDLAQFKIPHMGWDDVCSKQEHPLLDGLATANDFYFIHSYFVHCFDTQDVLLTGEYGIPYCAAFVKNNIIGVQFHPEKSQQAGLKFLSNFLRWSPC